MQKFLITALLFLVLTQVVCAEDFVMCEDEVYLNKNCTMLTPSISCPTLNYDIINLSGVAVVDNASLVVLNDSIYKLDFNYTNTSGYYVVRLCDGSTREVVVKPEFKNEMVIAIAIMIAILIFVFYKASVELPEQHWPLKMGMFLAMVSVAWAGMGYALSLAVENGLQSNVASTVTTAYEASIYVGYFIFAYFIIMILWYLMRTLASLVHWWKNRKNSEEDDYENYEGGGITSWD